MTERRIPWQRVPQGWIELAAFRDEEIAEKWWSDYLATVGDALDEETRTGLTDGFRAGRDVLRGAPFAFAGIFPWLDDETPTVFFVGTAILPSPEDARAARIAGSLSGLVRVGEDAHPEPFEALDGRRGSSTTSRYLLPTGGEVGVILGDVELNDESGQVFVVALTPDHRHLAALAPYAAIALDSTTLLRSDEEPPAYPAPEILAAYQVTVN